MGPNTLLDMYNNLCKYPANTIGRVLIAWFNDCVLGKSGQTANPTIAMIDPVPYYSIHVHLCLRIY